jgi:hypothetical protein
VHHGERSKKQHDTQNALYGLLPVVADRVQVWLRLDLPRRRLVRIRAGLLA